MKPNAGRTINGTPPTIPITTKVLSTAPFSTHEIASATFRDTKRRRTKHRLRQPVDVAAERNSHVICKRLSHAMGGIHPVHAGGEKCLVEVCHLVWRCMCWPGQRWLGNSQSSDRVGPSGDPIHFIKAAAARGWVTIELPVLPLLSWRLRHTSPFATQAYMSYKLDEIVGRIFAHEAVASIVPF